MNPDQSRDENTDNLYLRGTTWWVRFKIDGVMHRETLRTDDLVEARYRADALMRRATMRQYGSLNAGTGERVYFVHDTDACMVKVGISRDIGSRMRSLKVNSPNLVELLGSIRGSVELETVLHNFLAPFHHRREWYRATPAVLSFISGLVALDAEVVHWHPPYRPPPPYLTS